MSWHLSSRQLSDYAAGHADDAMAMSAEAHLMDCPTCRAALPVDETWLKANWAGIRDIVDRPRTGVLERALAACGLSEATARLLVATPALYRAWLVAMVVVLGGALVAAYTFKGGSLMFFFLAPVLPLAGVALAYGRHVDPAYEMTATTPLAGQRLLFLRALAVLAPALTLCMAAALLLPDSTGPVWAPVAWLLPALTLVTGSLALSRWIGLSASSSVFAGIWMAALALTRVAERMPTALFAPEAQAGWAIALAVALAACVAMYLRRA